MSDERESNHERMVDICQRIARFSKSPPGRRHGCVIARDGRYIIATGYNGPPRGEGHCDCGGRPKLYCEINCKAVHAEVNAIANAAREGISVNGCVAYVTKKPCLPCRGLLKNAGIESVHWDEPASGSDDAPDGWERLNG